MDTEAATRRKEEIPKLLEAGWDRMPYAINEQRGVQMHIARRHAARGRGGRRWSVR